MRTGDIVFFKRRSLIGRLITLMTGEWSHVGVADVDIRGNITIVEIDPPVSKTSRLEWSMTDPRVTRVSVLHIPEIVGDDEIYMALDTLQGPKVTYSYINAFLVGIDELLERIFRSDITMPAGWYQTQPNRAICSGYVLRYLDNLGYSAPNTTASPTWVKRFIDETFAFEESVLKE